MKKVLAILIAILPLILCLMLAWYADRMHVVPTRPNESTTTQATSSQPTDSGVSEPSTVPSSTPESTPSHPVTSPSTAPSKPATEPTQPEPSQPETEPPTEPSQPTTDPTQPETQPSAPEDIENGLGWG